MKRMGPDTDMGCDQMTKLTNYERTTLYCQTPILIVTEVSTGDVQLRICADTQMGFSRTELTAAYLPRTR
jgi:hypothetical protein